MVRGTDIGVTPLLGGTRGSCPPAGRACGPRRCLRRSTTPAGQLRYNIPDMAGGSGYGWRWVEGVVDARAERLELRHRADPSRVAAMVGPPRNRTFPVRLISEDPEVLADVRQELDFYLLEVGGPNPWGVRDLPLRDRLERVLHRFVGPRPTLNHPWNRGS